MKAAEKPEGCPTRRSSPRRMRDPVVFLFYFIFFFWGGKGDGNSYGKAKRIFHVFFCVIFVDTL